MNQNNNTNDYRVSIIGSGPAGFYAADHLFKNKEYNFSIDMYDRLPTPFGLVRSGVAPDHQKIKSVTRVFDKIAQNEGFRFFGNIEFGKDLFLEDIKKYYHIIIFATGAQTVRKMNIPGEELNGSHTASEFVAWYNGHPDYKDRTFDLDKESAAIIGVGNVAVDVARILCRTKDELSVTDIAEYALEKLEKSNVKRVYMIGRRGPAQAAFTNPELKELGNLEDADLITLKNETELDNLTREFVENSTDKTLARKIEILQDHNENYSGTKNKKLFIRFLLSPVEIIGDENNNITKIKLCKNELYKSDDESLRSKQTDQFEELDVGLVFRSIGYHGVALSDIPFNDNWGVISNDKGRIIDENNNFLPGHYVTGWVKRGPTGVIGTNKADSGETVKSIIDDITNDSVNKVQDTDIKNIEKLINQRKKDYLSYEEWLKVDKIETEKGAEKGKPRVKFTEIEEIIKAGKS